MALAPLTPNLPRITIVEPVIQPLKTYEFNFDTGEFAGTMVDGKNAVRQMILKALYTPRFRHIIYSANYGSELESLIGGDHTQELLQTEIERFIKEALTTIYDGIVTDCTNFTFDFKGDAVYVTFEAITNQGILELVVTL